MTIPANTTAEVHVPTDGGPVTASPRATFDGTDGSYGVYRVPSGHHTFTS